MKTMVENSLITQELAKVSLGLFGFLLCLLLIMPNIMAADTPTMEQGVNIQQLTSGQATVWAKTDRAAQLMVEYAYNEKFQGSVVLPGEYTSEKTHFTARQDLVGLPETAGKIVYVKVWFEDWKHYTKSDAVIRYFYTLS